MKEIAVIVWVLVLVTLSNDVEFESFEHKAECEQARVQYNSKLPKLTSAYYSCKPKILK
jgi:hypothetical protein